MAKFKFFRALVLVALVPALVALYGCGGSGVRGSGNVVKEARVVGSFKNIHSSGSFNLILLQGSVEGVQVEADDNLLNIIKTDNSNGELNIYASDDFSSSRAQNVYVTVKELAEVKIDGSGDVSSQTPLNLDNLNLEMAGSGSGKLNVNSKKLVAELSGSGDLELAGSAVELSIGVSGSGDVDADELQAGTANVSLAGSGDIRVNAREKLDVKLTGSGDVKYTGGAVVNSSVSGSGAVEKL
jgi:hypothetical protein